EDVGEVGPGVAVEVVVAAAPFGCGAVGVADFPGDGFALVGDGPGEVAEVEFLAGGDVEGGGVFVFADCAVDEGVEAVVAGAGGRGGGRWAGGGVWGVVKEPSLAARVQNW